MKNSNRRWNIGGTGGIGGIGGTGAQERLVISISMQMEAGGQSKDEPNPYLPPVPKGHDDLTGSTWFAYGDNEGLPRMMNLFDQYKIHVTSHVVGEAALKHPNLVTEIINRGHEVADHGFTWNSQFDMTYAEEYEFIKKSRDTLAGIAGIRPYGYNCNMMQRTPNTLKILQELGYIYHIDDVSRDEPFIIHVQEKDFVVVPYTIRCNDLLILTIERQTPRELLHRLIDEFDYLYEEGFYSKRLMSISFHDRIGGTPQMMKVINEFLRYAYHHVGVKFMRKIDIADNTLKDLSSLRV